MSWSEKIPMPTTPVWHYHVPRRCTCVEGLAEDENWSPEYPEETRADPPWPGEGWLVCGICDGDGWYWWRYEFALREAIEAACAALDDLREDPGYGSGVADAEAAVLGILDLVASTPEKESNE